MRDREPDLDPRNDPADHEPALRRQAEVVDREASRVGSFDSASGGYGSRSGDASGSGTGDGEPGTGEPMDDGTTAASTGAAGEGPTEWLRGAPGGRPDEGEAR